MTTTQNTAHYIDKKGTIRIQGGVQVTVKILDVKNSYGRERFLVTPMDGQGEAWTENVDISE